MNMTILPDRAKAVIEAKLCGLFPDEALRERVEGLLARYGSESWERESLRVRLAILKLAGSDVDKIEHLVQASKADYRDVLAWAECPNAMKIGLCDASKAEKERADRLDAEQYQRWLDE